MPIPLRKRDMCAEASEIIAILWNPPLIAMHLAQLSTTTVLTQHDISDATRQS